MTDPLEVLIVDDTAGCRDLYSLWFEAAHHVETAPNGAVALDLISDTTDIVLLDRNMPGPSGLDVAEEVRSESYDCQIVMVSSEPPDFEIVASPVDDYVQKPADRETVVTAVERIASQQNHETALSKFQSFGGWIMFPSFLSKTVEYNLHLYHLRIIYRYFSPDYIKAD